MNNAVVPRETRQPVISPAFRSSQSLLNSYGVHTVVRVTPPPRAAPLWGLRGVIHVSLLTEFLLLDASIAQP
ncbi:MAG: hypothetical protein FWH23_01440 [Bacteroidales bacterium]|nr:hypothetical protein [Bacteroidales bacterium]MCL2133842.1 hypothetical protein [Bacteroidales bacterium]